MNGVEVTISRGAQKEGLFDKEIVPVKVLQKDLDNPDNSGKEVVVDKDDGIRHNASVESMAKLKPVFAKDGCSTAGNSSSINDGAAASLLMRRSTATELGLSGSIIGKWVATQTVGCLPDEMGVGPAVAIPKLLEHTGISTEEVGIWEINEAFASQALYCIRKLGIDQSKVNPKGGAIALGHPLGMTGARQLATLMPELERQGKDVGVVSMCIGKLRSLPMNSGSITDSLQEREWAWQVCLCESKDEKPLSTQKQMPARRTPR